MQRRDAVPVATRPPEASPWHRDEARATFDGDEQAVKPQVLIVEDDHILRGLLVDSLRGSGYFRAEGAGCVAEAEHLLREAGLAFDGILLDATLPDGDGNEWCLALRRSGFRNPIIMLTGVAHDAAVQRSLDFGATDHMTKPVRVVDLLNRLTSTLAGSTSPRTPASTVPACPAPSSGTWQNRSNIRTD